MGTKIHGAGQDCRQTDKQTNCPRLPSTTLLCSTTPLVWQHKILKRGDTDLKDSEALTLNTVFNRGGEGMEKKEGGGRKKWQCV